MPDTQSDMPKAMGSPATNALANIGITRLEQLTGISEGQLKEMHGVGPKAINVLRDALAEQGLAFKLDSDFPKLAAPAVRALSGAGILRLDQLANYTEAEIKDLHGIGANALKQLQSAMAAKGLSFKV